MRILKSRLERPLKKGCGPILNNLVAAWNSLSFFGFHSLKYAWICVYLTKSEKHPSCMSGVRCPHYNPIPKQLLTISLYLCLSHSLLFFSVYVLIANLITQIKIQRTNLLTL